MFALMTSKMPSAARSSVDAKRLCDLVLHGLPGRRRRRSACAPPSSALLVEVAEHDEASVTVGVHAAAHVAGGPRHRLGALRPDVEESLRVDPRDRSAACADADHIDERDADAVAADVDVLDKIDLAVADQRDVAACSADVEREHLGLAEARGEVRRWHWGRRRGRS